MRYRLNLRLDSLFSRFLGSQLSLCNEFCFARSAFPSPGQRWVLIKSARRLFDHLRVGLGGFLDFLRCIVFGQRDRDVEGIPNLSPIPLASLIIVLVGTLCKLLYFVLLQLQCVSFVRLVRSTLVLKISTVEFRSKGG